jgi:hypothetical protein
LKRNHALALRYAEALLEDPDFMGIGELFGEEFNLTEEDEREIYGHMSKITLDYPREWDEEK